MADHLVTWLDVFAERPLAGNQLAVVHDADPVDDSTMLAFARETKFSETTFVQSAGEDGADYRNRIWTPDGELPFAGHPSLGTAVAVAARRAAGATTLRQQTGAGVQPIDVEPREQPRWWASMLQEPAQFGAEIDPAPALAAIGLPPDAAAPGLPPQFVSCGIFHLMLPVASAHALARARPDWDAIARVLEPGGGVVLYAAALEGDRAQARGFTGSRQMGEDPATGSAAGPLCAYAAARGVASSLRVEQGVAMGRPSVLHASVEGDRVRVGGEVALLAEGTLHL